MKIVFLVRSLNSGVSDQSSWTRKYLAQLAWEQFENNPIIGNGTGSSREMVKGAHNQYFAFMQDHGFLGAIILPLLVLAATWGVGGEIRGLAIPFACAVLLLSFFPHDPERRVQPCHARVDDCHGWESREQATAKTSVGEARVSTPGGLPSGSQPVRSST